MLLLLLSPTPTTLTIPSPSMENREELGKSKGEEVDKKEKGNPVPRGG